MRLGGWVMMLSAMIIFLTLIGMETGLTTTLDSLGISINQTSGEFVADIESSSIWDAIFGTAGVLVLIGTAGLVLIGLFGRGYDPSLAYAPFIVAVGALYISTFWSIISYVAGFNQWWMTSIIGLIFATLGLGFIMSCINYFGGRG